MEKTELKKTLAELLREYSEHCQELSKKFEKKNKFAAPVAPTLDGFMEWLEVEE